MDDEALARALQAEEYAAVHPQPNNEERNKAAMVAEIHDSVVKAKSVEDASAQQHALSLIPLADIRQKAAATVELDRLLLGDAAAAASSQPGVDDLVVQGMLHWFKHSFFKWVDQPPCNSCGGPTSHPAMSAPTPAESADGAGRVEVYRCSLCQQTTRFPRYTNVQKLLTTRRGRCGEWAHTFLMFLRAAGYDARHVTDLHDHVWCEYYSKTLERWVHVDACEEAWDKPLLYEGGWGKKLAYVLAASRHGVADVSRRYVVKPANLPSHRTTVPETWLTQTLAALTSQLRSGSSAQTRRQLALRDAAELLQLMALEGQQQQDTAAAAAAGGLPGRQSGSEAWRHARGEMGTSVAPTAQSSSQQATRYKLAQDHQLPPLFAAAGRITGGACRAAGENGAEAAHCLFDGSSSSKWLDFGGGGEGGQSWVEYKLLPSQSAVVVSHYDLIAADDCAERDPCDWVLECIPENNSSTSSSSDASSSNGLGVGVEGWVVLDGQAGQVFSRRHQLHSYKIAAASHMASRQWRLRITRTANPLAANSVQLSCWNMYASSSEGSCSKRAGGADGAGICSQLYLKPQMMINLQQLIDPKVAAADGSTGNTSAAAAAAVSADGSHGTTGGAAEATGRQFQDAAATTKRILTNMQHNPDNSKYWQISASAVKLQPVLHTPVLLAVLFEAGFRPVIVPQGPLPGQEQQLRLVADESTANLTVIHHLCQLLGH